MSSVVVTSSVKQIAAVPRRVKRGGGLKPGLRVQKARVFCLSKCKEFPDCIPHTSGCARGRLAARARSFGEKMKSNGLVAEFASSLALFSSDLRCGLNRGDWKDAVRACLPPRRWRFRMPFLALRWKFFVQLPEWSAFLPWFWEPDRQTS